MRYLLIAICFFAMTHLHAQDFTVRWHGQSFFSVQTPKGKTLVFDPHAIPEFGRPNITADIILCSHRHNDHAQPDVIANHASARIFHGLNDKMRSPDWNKIDEKVGQIRIRTVPTYHDTVNGMQRGKNSVFVVEAEGLTFCHLGDLGHELEAAQVKLIGPVDVVFVPCGGIYTINGEKAKKVVELLKPKMFAVPMHFGMPNYDELLPVDEFLEGQKNVKKLLNTNEFKIPTDSKPENCTVVVLGVKKEDAPMKKP